nr:ATP-dependent DNA helicase PIF1-like [Tanacetum cinerariifolium]
DEICETKEFADWILGIGNGNINEKNDCTLVMYMRNIRLCNGTRLQITRMGTNVIEAKIISRGDMHSSNKRAYIDAGLDDHASNMTKKPFHNQKQEENIIKKYICDNNAR